VRLPQVDTFLPTAEEQITKGSRVARLLIAIDHSRESSGLRLDSFAILEASKCKY